MTWRLFFALIRALAIGSESNLGLHEDFAIGVVDPVHDLRGTIVIGRKERLDPRRFHRAPLARADRTTTRHEYRGRMRNFL